MHDINWIRNNIEKFQTAMQNRNAEFDLDKILNLDEKRRQKIIKIQGLQQKKNESAKLIGSIANKGSDEFKEALKAANEIKQEIQILENDFSEDQELESYLSFIPNIQDDMVPVGPDETYNKEVKKFKEPKILPFSAKQHFDIGENLGIMDFETAAKMSGSRFVVLKNDLAKLERVLANFMLDSHTNNFGYNEISAPFLVKDHAMYNVGQLPKFAEDSFLTTDGFRLIPTCEVTLTNIVADSILSEEELPLRFTAYTPCFRSEAGSAGRDTRGMIRLHQFSKVELVSITTEEKSADEHERMLSAAELILQSLDLPYRVMMLPSGDMGFSSKRTYDIEVWLPGQNAYREISSCSNCGDFQARRMKARYKNSNKENKLVHTLNGSGLAVGRTIVAILENYQQEDGSVIIPEKLVPYFGKKKIEMI